MFLFKFRFRYEYGNWRKQTTNVDFPIECLDMSSFIVGPKLHSSEYALYSVLVCYFHYKIGHSSVTIDIKLKTNNSNN